MEKESDKTLNDKYPNNKGIFFYIGTRAENKWIYLYDKDDRENLEECTELGVDDYVENGEIEIGQIASAVRSVRPVAEIVAELVREYDEALSLLGR